LRVRGDTVWELVGTGFDELVSTCECLEGPLAEFIRQCTLSVAPGEVKRAGVFPVAWATSDDAGIKLDRALGGDDDVEQGDVGWFAGESVATIGAGDGLQEFCAHQICQDLRDVANGDIHRGGDLACFAPPPSVVTGDIDGGADRVIAFATECCLHCLLPYQRFSVVVNVTTKLVSNS